MLKFISWYSMGAPNVGFAKGLSKVLSVEIGFQKSLSGVRFFFSLGLSEISKYR
jgi:hypothetical protein